jgi:RimJ/RimL family protein N-acetyltransferase
MTATPPPLPLPDLVRTARLRLRPFREEDVERFATLIGEWQVARWLARVPHPYGLEDGRAWVAMTAANRAAGRSLDLLTVRAEDGEPVGGIGLNLGTGELGYWLGLSHQGLGYGTEMVRALIPVALRDLGLPLLWAGTAPENERSRRVLEKAGFSYHGLRPYDFGLRGGLAPAHHYELTAERWRSLPEESA